MKVWAALRVLRSPRAETPALQGSFREPRHRETAWSANNGPSRPKGKQVRRFTLNTTARFYEIKLTIRKPCCCGQPDVGTLCFSARGDLLCSLASLDPSRDAGRARANHSAPSR